MLQKQLLKKLVCHILQDIEAALLQDQQMERDCSYSFVLHTQPLPDAKHSERRERSQGEESRQYRDKQGIVIALKGFPNGREIELSKSH